MIPQGNGDSQWRLLYAETRADELTKVRTELNATMVDLQSRYKVSLIASLESEIRALVGIPLDRSVIGNLNRWIFIPPRMALGSSQLHLAEMARFRHFNNGVT